ncbi:MAG TPA: hypothetical protein EYP91_16285, partial [Gammaproteobacteria bacterium]|nr:hypothetical protein [Gammaproteobacteria bacterium]
ASLRFPNLVQEGFANYPSGPIAAVILTRRSE